MRRTGSSFSIIFGFSSDLRDLFAFAGSAASPEGVDMQTYARDASTRVNGRVPAVGSVEVVLTRR